LPTLVVNNRQYRGKLERKAVLKAICAGFEETTEPNVCLSDGKSINYIFDYSVFSWIQTAESWVVSIQKWKLMSAWMTTGVAGKTKLLM
jgi:hypothetical protein